MGVIHSISQSITVVLGLLFCKLQFFNILLTFNFIISVLINLFHVYNISKSDCTHVRGLCWAFIEMT